MRKFLMLCAVLMLVTGSSAFAADLAGPERGADAKRACADGRWAVVVVSTSPEKDAYAFDYCKDLKRGAEQSGVQYFKSHLMKGGYRTSMPYRLGVSQDFVIGLYCRSGDRTRADGLVGMGRSPAEAASYALEHARGFRTDQCYFVALRHGSAHKRFIEESAWRVTVQGRTAHAIGAVNALNDALRVCGRRPASECVIADVVMGSS